MKERILHSDPYLTVTTARIELEGTTYLLDDVDGISSHFERHYALITLHLSDGTERTFAPPNRPHAITILDALTRALAGEGPQ